MNKGKVVLLCITLALLAFGGWVYSKITWVEQEINMGFSEEAVNYPFLAAQLFLEKTGVRSEQRRGFALLDNLGTEMSEVADGDTIILVNSFNALDYERVNALLGWVQNGGTLFYSTRNSLRGNEVIDYDYLMTLLGVYHGTLAGGDIVREDRVQEQPEAPSDVESLEELIERLNAANAIRCPDGVPLTTVIYGDVSTAVNFQGNRFLQVEETEEGEEEWTLFPDSSGVRFVRKTLGRGVVNITTDNQLWNNYRISCFDHAYNLSQLTSENKVWFLINQESTPLFAMIWNSSPVTMVLLGICLLLFFHKKSERFGPVLVDKALERRSFLEHLHAGAGLMWRNGKSDQMILSLREEIIATVKGRLFNNPDLDEKSIVAHISSATRKPGKRIYRYLYAKLPDKISERVFVDYVSALKKMQDSIQKG